MATASAQPVPPGAVFDGPVINIRAPQSQGWVVLQNNATGMAFARSAAGINASEVAVVKLFPLGATPTPEALVALIKAGVEADTSKRRFDVLDAKFEYTERRGYPCVEASTLTIDKVPTGLFSHKEMILEIRALYCRHPERPDQGFSAGYSHRGQWPDTDLSSNAQSFIEGVQVPARQPPEPSSQPTNPGGG